MSARRRQHIDEVLLARAADVARRRHSGAPSVSVVVAALNEAENLPVLLPKMDGHVDEIILVDGASDDGTSEVAKRLDPRVRVVRQFGSGKGAALRTGFAAASGDIIVTMDADCSMDPGEIPAFVGVLQAGADYVKGSRFLHGAGTTDMPFHRRLGNGAFVLMVRIFFGGKYTDLCYGYNAFWREVLPRLNLDGDGFEIETVMNIRALRARLRVVEIGSVESERMYGDAKLRTFRDGWRVLKAILKERFLARTALRTEDHAANLRNGTETTLSTDASRTIASPATAERYRSSRRGGPRSGPRGR